MLNVSLRRNVLGGGAPTRQPRGTKTNLGTSISAGPTVASIGYPMDLTYPHTHLGNGPHALYLLAQGKLGREAARFCAASQPKVLLGVGPLERSDGDSFIQMIVDIQSIRERILAAALSGPRHSHETTPRANPDARYHHTIADAVVVRAPRQAAEAFLGDSAEAPTQLPTATQSPRLNSESGIQGWGAPILHAYASTPGAYDLGFSPGRTSILGESTGTKNVLLPFGHSSRIPEGGSTGGKLPAEAKPNAGLPHEHCSTVLYLLGADVVHNTCTVTPSHFVIYQGHHGDIGAKQADVILPSTTYVEKNAIYVNTEGRVQQSQQAVPTAHEVRDD